MSSVLSSREVLEPVSMLWDSEPRPRTEVPAHVIISDQFVETSQMLQAYGFSYEQWKAAMVCKEVLRTHCVIEGIPYTLEQFEAEHHVDLGQE